MQATRSGFASNAAAGRIARLLSRSRQLAPMSRVIRTLACSPRRVTRIACAPCNQSGTSAYSNTASATTSAGDAAPAAPSNLAAVVVSSSQINLTWTDTATNESGFRIERCSGSGCTSFAEIATVGANVTSYQNTGLLASTSYSYRVRAYNQSGTSAYSNTASATTQGAAPSAPSNLSGGCGRRAARSI